MLAGYSQRAALRFSRLQYGPPWIEAGPFGDEEACAYDTGWTLAEAVTRKQSTTTQLEPAGPITPSERGIAVFWLGEETTAAIETKIATRYGITAPVRHSGRSGVFQLPDRPDGPHVPLR
jgi:hypothetical protein